jgi:hypothetical protein
MKEFLSDFIKRITSRRFIAWAVGTVLFVRLEKMEAIHWLILTGIYITNKFLDVIIESIRNKYAKGD